MRRGDAPSTVRDLLDRADAERAAGRGDAAARLYDEAVTRCRSEDDLAGWTEAVLGAASVYLFGAEPGRLPAQLYDVLARTTDDATRARLAAALARCWAYAGHAARAVQFADEAVARAQRVGDPELLADCLDAALAAHWGPDELDVRRTLAARLDDVAAHVLDPDARLQAHLWGLQVACETLDLPGDPPADARPGAPGRGVAAGAVLRRITPADARPAARPHRHHRAADRASPRPPRSRRRSPMRGWCSRRWTCYTAAQSGDTAACAAGAAEVEAFALAEGATAVCAEAAFLWVCAGQLGPRPRARAHASTAPCWTNCPAT